MTLQELRVKKDYYTVAQVAEIYHVSQVTVCNWCRAGILQAHKEGDGKGRWKVHPQAIEDIETRQEELIEASRKYWVRLLVKMRR
jgi:predicted site-specific integrase-resolvase